MASDSAPETPAEDGPRLIPLGQHTGKPPMPLTRLATVIGSQKRSHLQLESSTISKHHAIVVVGEDEAYIADLGSRTKVKVNGSEMREGRLHDGDEIRLGKFLLKFASPKKTAGDVAPLPKMELVDGAGVSEAIDGRFLVIGSRPGSDLIIEEAAVSGRHAVIFQVNGQRYVRDLDSRTGTRLNGKRVRQAELKVGDEIRVGSAKLRVELSKAFAPKVEKAGEAVAEKLGAGDAIGDAVSTPVRAAAPGGAELPSLSDLPPLEVEREELAAEEIEEPGAGEVPVTAKEDAPVQPVKKEVAKPISVPVPAAEAIAKAEPDVGMDLSPTGELMSLAPEIAPVAAKAGPTLPPAPELEPIAEEPVVEEPLGALELGPAIEEERSATADEIDLSKDPDLTGVGPGDTAVIKPAPAAPAIELSGPVKGGVKDFAPVVEAKEGEGSGKGPELSWPKRGWRTEGPRAKEEVKPVEAKAPEPVVEAKAPQPEVKRVLEAQPVEKIEPKVEAISPAVNEVVEPVVEAKAPQPEPVEETAEVFVPPIADEIAPAVIEEPAVAAVQPEVEELATDEQVGPAVQEDSGGEEKPRAKRGRPPKGSTQRKGVLNRTSAKRVPPPEVVEGIAEDTAAEPVQTSPAPYAAPDEATAAAEIDFLNLEIDLKGEEGGAEEKAGSDLVAMEEAGSALGAREESDRPLIIGEEIRHGAAVEAEIFETTIGHDTPTAKGEKAPGEDGEPPIVGLRISLDDFPGAKGEEKKAEKIEPAVAPVAEIAAPAMAAAEVKEAAIEEAKVEIEREAEPEIALPREPEPVAPAEVEVESIAPAEAEVEIGHEEVMEASESAAGATLDLDLELPPMEAEPAVMAEAVEPVLELGDTEFGKRVEELVGESTGPLVEEREEEEIPQAEIIEPAVAESPIAEPPIAEQGILKAEVSEPAVVEEKIVEREIAAVEEKKLEPVAEAVAEVKAPEPVAPVTPPPPPPPPAQAPPVSQPAKVQVKAMPARPKEPEAPLSSLAGTALFGVGAVNIDHFLGGMPVRLTPAPPPPSKPQPFSRTPINFEGSWSKPLTGGRDEDEPEAMAHIPRLIPSPLDQATSEKAAAGGGQPGPFSTAKLDADSGPPGRYSEAQSKEPRAMAFDGLAMGAVTEKDVFSEFPTPEAKASDAEFGGAPVEEGPAPTPVGGDAVFTQSPKAPGGPAVNLEKDFAEDEFWNRTDEQDDARKGREWDPDEAVAAHHENVSREAEEPLAEEEQTEEILAETPEEPAAGEIAEEAIGEAIADEALGIEPEQGAPAVEHAAENADEHLGAEMELPAVENEELLSPELEKELGLGAEAESDLGKEARLTAEETRELDMGAGDVELDAEVARAEESARQLASEIKTATVSKEKPKRRGLRWLIPFLMVAMLVSMAGAVAAIHFWAPVKASVSGSLTYVNFNWVQGTDDGNEFQAQQQRLLSSDQTRQRAMAILAAEHKRVSPGFLGDSASYVTVARSVSIASQHSAGQPQTIISLTANGNDEASDRYRMNALLAAVMEANGPVLDENRRQRDVADKARRGADEAVAALEQLKGQVGALQHTVSQGPASDDFDALTVKKTQSQRARFAAEDEVDEDRRVLDKTQADQPANAPAAARSADPQLTQLRQQIDDLSGKLKTARNVQTLSVADTRAKLQSAMKNFEEIVSRIDGQLEAGAALKATFDAASESQEKNQPQMITLMADGSDFEKQLEDTRRDLEESIQGRQQQAWAADSRLVELQTALDSAQHRYNASVGEGVTEAKILEPLQKEIDQRTAEIKARQAELAIDPGDVKVEVGLSKLIESLRSKILAELKDVAAAMAPVDKQLSSLNDSAAPLPQAQQKQAWEIRRSLAVLDDARQQYAQAIAGVQIAPSLSVTDLQQQIDQLQARFDHRQLALADEMQKSADPRVQKLAAIQKKLADDKDGLAKAKADYDGIRVEYDRQAGLREDAKEAQAKLTNLGDVVVKRTADVDTAVKDRDQKTAQADRLFDLKPLADADVIGTADDPRWTWSLYAVAGLAVFFAMATFAASHLGSRGLESGPLPDADESIVMAEIVGERDVDDEDDHEAAVV